MQEHRIGLRTVGTEMEGTTLIAATLCWWRSAPRKRRRRSQRRRAPRPPVGRNTGSPAGSRWGPLRRPFAATTLYLEGQGDAIRRSTASTNHPTGRRRDDMETELDDGCGNEVRQRQREEDGAMRRGNLRGADERGGRRMKRRQTW